MTRRPFGHRFGWCAGFALFFLTGASRPAAATISYTISLAHPEQHLFHVAMTIPDVQDEVTVQIPAWNALYEIRDFSGHIRQVEAFAGTDKAKLEKIDKQTWRVSGHGTITVRYATYWDEPGPFGTQINAEHAFINPAMILMYSPERRAEDARISLLELPREWRADGPSLSAATDAGPARNFEFGAGSYDALTDAPIEAGRFEKFQLSGVTPPITVIVHGDNWKQKHIEEQLRKICLSEIELMGGAPFTHYTFIYHIGRAAAGAGGGMEHSNATAISIPSDEFVENVSAHEFFHLWNVKRIRPATLEPVDYTKEQYTRALWFAEGVTNTYAAFTLLRSGVWSKAQFYDDFGSQISELEARPANKWQSAEQSSLDTWLEKYALYNQPEYSVSYYTKGQVLGDLLDLLIRDHTDNEKSLDDVLRQMNSDFAKQGRFYRDSLDVKMEAEKVTGSSFADFFEKYVAGTEPFPYGTVLPLAGLELRTVERIRAALDFTADRDSSGVLVVSTVEPGSSAANAGLRPGDVIFSVNGAEPPRRLERWVASQKPGGIVSLRVRRDGNEMKIEFSLGQTKDIYYRVIENSQASEKAKRIREGFLHGVTHAVAAH